MQPWIPGIFVAPTPHLGSHNPMKSLNVNVRSAVRIAITACAAAAATQGAIAGTPQAVDPPAPQAATATATASTAAPAQTLQTVVVTGTLIALSPNDVSVSPVTSVNQKAFQNVGAVRVEDQLQNMPQFTAAQNSGESIGSNGTASLNLYGLGQNRTLVLLNGRRMGPGGGSANSPDIDQIPAALIQRVDVLTGGASSTYGADAVAGAVNFVLDTHFTGVKLDGTYSFNNHSNNDQADLTLLRNFGAKLPPSTVNTGANRDMSILMGWDFADNKGNATAYFTFTSTSPAVGSQFDDAGCTIIGGKTTTGPLKCGGSETMATGAFIESGLVNGHSSTLVSDTVDPKTGLMRPIQSTDLYNYGAASYFQRSLKRYTGGAFVHYDLNDNAQLYSETMWSNIETV